MHTEQKPKEYRQQKEPKTLVLTREEELVRRIKPESSSSRQQRLSNKRYCISRIIKTRSCLSKLVTLVLLTTIIAITVITTHGTWRCWRWRSGSGRRRSGIAIAIACLPKWHLAKTPEAPFTLCFKRWKTCIVFFTGAPGAPCFWFIFYFYYDNVAVVLSLFLLMKAMYLPIVIILYHKNVHKLCSFCCKVMSNGNLVNLIGLFEVRSA